MLLVLLDNLQDGKDKDKLAPGGEGFRGAPECPSVLGSRVPLARCCFALVD